ncbi:ThiF family adenylyltransferase [bacterium]|nr:MAG: ThiF family adenylyltransferase [bacterium]
MAKKIIIKDNFDRSSFKPVKLDARKNFEAQIRRLKLPNGVKPDRRPVKVIDQYAIQLEEVFLLRNPKYRFDKDYHGEFKQFAAKNGSGDKYVTSGNWFYYPWLHTVIHFLPDAMHQEVRTGRNRNLITASEQKKFYNSVIGILGMSVGSHVALTIAMTGGARHIKLADLDVLSASNMNRIRTGFVNIEVPKVVAVARQIYEMNPYAKVELFADGLTKENLPKFLKGTAKLDVLVEEMDQPYFKMRARELARPLGIPVIMAADNADSIIVDVERYDQNKKYPILHGILGKMTAQEFSKVHPQDLPRVIAKMAGAEMSTVRMIESVMQVGKTIYSWPQLGNAANLCGSVLTYLARKIILGENVKSGRTDFNLDSAFLPPSKAETKKRDGLIKMMGM